VQDAPVLTAGSPVRRFWWAGLLGVVVLGVHVTALADRLRCRVHGCPGPRSFALDAVGGVPRLLTSALLLGLAGVAGVGAVRAAGRARAWWCALALGGAGLAAAKVTSVHSADKASAPVLVLAVSLVVAAAGLGLLGWTARRWAVPAGRPVVVALAAYAAAALLLDPVAGLASTAPGEVGHLLHRAVSSAEELGEALTAVLVLVVARAWTPAAADPQPAGSTRTGCACRTVKVTGGPSVVVVPGTAVTGPPSTLKVPDQVVVTEAVQSPDR
jgi:hypothetical protein